MSTFFERIESVVDGRLFYSWGVAVGLSRSSIQRMQHLGGEPNAATMRRICDVERCNIAWLQSGTGAPYLVNTCDSAAEVYRAVNELFPQSEAVLLVHDGKRCAVVIGTYVTKEPKNSKPFRYLEWAVISGLVCSDLMERMSTLEALRVAHVPPADMDRLIHGQMGNWELIGDLGGTRGIANSDAVFQRAVLSTSALKFRALTRLAFDTERAAMGVSEGKPVLYLDKPVQTQSDDWIEKIRTLPAEVQRALRVLVDCYNPK